MRKMVVTAKDGAGIPVYVFDAGDSAKGTVVVSHGFGEHGMMYSELAEVLVEAGYACTLFDQRGHGEPPDNNQKWFGIIPGYGCFLDDIVSVSEAASQIAPGSPVALYGHSMGGNIVINALLRDASGYACAVLEAPWLGLYKAPSPLIAGIAKLAGSISPNLATSNALKPEVLTDDEARLGAYTDDPLYHGSISFRMYNGISKGCANAIANAARLPIPALLAYAKDDKVLCNTATMRFADGAGDMVTVKEYGSRHAIHNNLVRDDFFRDVVAFLDEHMAK